MLFTKNTVVAATYLGALLLASLGVTPTTASTIVKASAYPQNANPSKYCPAGTKYKRHACGSGAENYIKGTGNGRVQYGPFTTDNYLQYGGHCSCCCNCHNVWIECTGAETKPPASAFGDPHFRLWNGTSYDFHGGCDLVLLQNDQFANGQGMRIHVRTTIKTWWSNIQSAAVQLGENTLQITGGSEEEGIKYKINGEEEKELETGTSSLGDYTVNFRRVNGHQSQTRIDLGNHGDALSVETLRTFVRVNLKDKKQGESFNGSLGMLGSYPTGKMVGRDGKTVIENPDDFGQEWMVRPTDSVLFVDSKFPTHCPLPAETQKKEARRRLAEGSITEEDAGLACARVAEHDRDACIFDVLATQDKEMAGSF